MHLLRNRIDEFKSLCGKYHVEKIYLFGSALKPQFNEQSDIDLLVRFQQMDITEYFDNYIQFKDELKSLLGREVDLVEEQTLKNPILIQSINRNKELIYG